MSKTTLVHMSPEKINKIVKCNNLIFEDVFFFSTNGYTPGSANYRYEIKDIDDTEIIEALDIDEYYFKLDEHGESTSELNIELQKIREEFAEEFGISETQAWDFICDFEDPYEILADEYEPEGLAEISWRTQYYQACAAKVLDFRFVQSCDENGTVYFARMYGRDNEMELVEKI
jgi:hypothetical protein